MPCKDANRNIRNEQEKSPKMSQGLGLTASGGAKGGRGGRVDGLVQRKSRGAVVELAGLVDAADGPVDCGFEAAAGGALAQEAPLQEETKKMQEDCKKSQASKHGVPCRPSPAEAAARAAQSIQLSPWHSMCLPALAARASPVYCFAIALVRPFWMDSWQAWRVSVSLGSSESHWVRKSPTSIGNLVESRKSTLCFFAVLKASFMGWRRGRQNHPLGSMLTAPTAPTAPCFTESRIQTWSL